jgi:hypothetical protein
MSLLDFLPEDLQREVCRYFSDHDIEKYSSHIFTKILDEEDIFWSEKLKEITPIKISKKEVYNIMKKIQRIPGSRDLLKYKFYNGCRLDRYAWNIGELIKDEEFLKQQDKIRNKDDFTILEEICANANYTDNFEDYFNILLKAGGNINGHGDNIPLITAAHRGNIRAVELFLKAGANVDAAYRDGYTALFYSSGNPDIVKMLLIHGANINKKTTNGQTALYGAWNEICIKNLVEAGIDVNARDNEGQTALHYFIKFGYPNKNIRMLIEAGADINITDSNGITPAALALQQGIDLNNL